MLLEAILMALSCAVTKAAMLINNLRGYGEYGADGLGEDMQMRGVDAAEETERFIRQSRPGCTCGDVVANLPYCGDHDCNECVII